MPSSTTQPPFHLPTINIHPYLTNPSGTESEKIIDEIRTACLSHGFFQITGHGISKSLQESLFQAAQSFFALEYAEKKNLDAKGNRGMRGYDVLASQSYENDVMPDLKEGFYIGLDLPESHPAVKAKRFFMGPSVWPSTQLLPKSAFQDPCEKYYAAIYSLSLKVLEMIACTLPYGSHIFDEFTTNDPAAPLRLLHYPPAPETTAKRQLGASAHTDFGAITLLLQDHNAGLEVLDTERDEWVPIDPNPDAYVVNIGDMLSKWTSGQYKSSVHRVLNKNPTDRYSVVFFFDGNLDSKLAPLDGSSTDEQPLTVEEYMIERMTTTYGTGKRISGMG